MLTICFGLLIFDPIVCFGLSALSYSDSFGVDDSFVHLEFGSSNGLNSIWRKRKIYPHQQLVTLTFVHNYN